MAGREQTVMEAVGRVLEADADEGIDEVEDVDADER
jgi:hypothetical protein